MKPKEELAEEYANSKKWMDGGPENWVKNVFIAGFEAAKSNLQTDYVDIALRLCNIEINRHLLEKIVDVCSHVLDKGGQATFQDIEELKLKWQSQRV